jgi:hypothetical protein
MPLISVLAKSDATKRVTIAKRADIRFIVVCFLACLDVNIWVGSYYTTSALLRLSPPIEIGGDEQKCFVIGTRTLLVG